MAMPRCHWCLEGNHGLCDRYSAGDPDAQKLSGDCGCTDEAHKQFESIWPDLLPPLRNTLDMSDCQRQGYAIFLDDELVSWVIEASLAENFHKNFYGPRDIKVVNVQNGAIMESYSSENYRTKKEETPT